MAKIILVYRRDLDKEEKVMYNYNLSAHKALLLLDHEVTAVGINQPGYQHINDMSEKELKSHDLLIDLDCGRGSDGRLHFQYHDRKCPIPSAVRFIDTHGYPSLHRRLAKNYQYVFFAVYRKRDLFSNHGNAYWCPNASDDVWFDYTLYLDHWNRPKIDFGFFGSKGGLDRADELKYLCDGRQYRFDVREVGRTNRQRWPYTQKAMANCKILFNRGQKHDGPNQRVIESMLMGRPLISDRDREDGMKLLFEEGTHFLGYESMAELAIQMDWCMTNESLAKSMGRRAYKLCKEKHLIKHRMEQILEVCLT